MFLPAQQLVQLAKSVVLRTIGRTGLAWVVKRGRSGPAVTSELGNAVRSRLTKAGYDVESKLLLPGTDSPLYPVVSRLLLGP